MCVSRGSGCDQNKEPGLLHSRRILWLHKLLHHASVSKVISEVSHAFFNLVFEEVNFIDCFTLRTVRTRFEFCKSVLYKKTESHTRVHRLCRPGFWFRTVSYSSDAVTAVLLGVYVPSSHSLSSHMYSSV